METPGLSPDYGYARSSALISMLSILGILSTCSRSIRYSAMELLPQISYTPSITILSLLTSSN